MGLTHDELKTVVLNVQKTRLSWLNDEEMPLPKPKLKTLYFTKYPPILLDDVLR